MRACFGALFISMASVAAAGCGGQSDLPEDGTGNVGVDGTGQNGTGTGTGTGPLTPAADGKCNSLDLAGVSSIKDLRGKAVPAMTGGTISDGTYYLTKYEWHKPENALHTRKTVMVISGSKFQWAAVREGEKEVRISGNITTSGDQVMIQQTCPEDEWFGWDKFTVTGSWLILHDQDDVKTATFTRQ